MIKLEISRKTAPEAKIAPEGSKTRVLGVENDRRHMGAPDPGPGGGGPNGQFGFPSPGTHFS